MDLESLTNRYMILIIVKTVLIILALLLIWVLPCFKERIKKKHNTHKTKRKVRLEKESKRKALICQIIVSVLLVIAGALVIKGDLNILNALELDTSQNSIAKYEGDAFLLSSSPYPYNPDVLFDLLIIDSRLVAFENSDETYQIDMSKVPEGWFEDSGEFHGKITYGKNSKFILKIE